MALVYVACGLALVVCSGVLFVLQGVVGAPTPVRRWMNPFASPLIALVGCAAYAVVASLLLLAVSRALSLPFELNSTAGDIVWYVGSGVVALATAFFTARWWQPIYFAGVATVLLMAGLQEEQTISGQFEEIIQIALLAGALASIGVLLRFAHMARSQRERKDAVGTGRIALSADGTRGARSPP